MKSNLTPIYLRAMGKIAREVEKYSCAAISTHYAVANLSHSESAKAVRVYAKIFSPDGRCGGMWDIFARTVRNGHDPKGHRLTMLALAAVCWRDFMEAKR
ncbi:MAG: hypothetical protein UY28_C0004G0019 [Candidatus Amesbacteria bacterium GW2011_GWB1_48_13]|uniref:Uncharacterized protein n=1 Tax=Candidatus Amesbacteria bacterium GW2011_GWB1_48_13 TaxID=1618362 RepID=A0A0G1UW51_9BACT|nr:MAG: hypothetical protein UY28_C0004G0019 [Candidatus Amesbacteria bacterium GW2011_GWB1_48_13]